MIKYVLIIKKKKNKFVTESHYGYCLDISPWNKNLYFSSSKGEANMGIHYFTKSQKYAFQNNF